jgi:hypothetical protein
MVWAAAAGLRVVGLAEDSEKLKMARFFPKDFDKDIG